MMDLWQLWMLIMMRRLYLLKFLLWTATTTGLFIQMDRKWTNFNQWESMCQDHSLTARLNFYRNLIVFSGQNTHKIYTLCPRIMMLKLHSISSRFPRPWSKMWMSFTHICLSVYCASALNERSNADHLAPALTEHCQPRIGLATIDNSCDGGGQPQASNVRYERNAAKVGLHLHLHDQRGRREDHPGLFAAPNEGRIEVQANRGTGRSALPLQSHSSGLQKKVS